MSLTNDDIEKNKYSIEELEKNIGPLSMTMLVNYQILTADFCAKYILDEDNMDCYEERDRLDYWYVLKKQPHITREELLESMKKYNR
jgi:hypothetical protein